jgi:hypothetical protein
MKFADTLKGKRKNQWKNSSAVEEEDQLKVTYVVCPKSSCSMFIKILFYKF